jgi:hypothetical protein
LPFVDLSKGALDGVSGFFGPARRFSLRICLFAAFVSALHHSIVLFVRAVKLLRADPQDSRFWIPAKPFQISTKRDAGHSAVSLAVPSRLKTVAIGSAVGKFGVRRDVVVRVDCERCHGVSPLPPVFCGHHIHGSASKKRQGNFR